MLQTLARALEVSPASRVAWSSANFITACTRKSVAQAVCQILPKPPGSDGSWTSAARSSTPCVDKRQWKGLLAPSCSWRRLDHLQKLRTSSQLHDEVGRGIGKSSVSARDVLDWQGVLRQFTSAKDFSMP